MLPEVFHLLRIFPSWKLPAAFQLTVTTSRWLKILFFSFILSQITAATTFIVFIFFVPQIIYAVIFDCKYRNKSSLTGWCIFIVTFVIGCIRPRLSSFRAFLAPTNSIVTFLSKTFSKDFLACFAHLFISNHIELQSNALVCLWKHIRRNRIMQLPYETDRSLSFMLHIICIS